MEIDIPKNAFIFEGNDYDVPCVFQIWEKKDILRENIKLKTKSDLFLFTIPENANFAIRRVGGLAGKMIIDFQNYSTSSHYYILVLNKKEKEKITNFFKTSYDEFQFLSRNTAGNPSLLKSEIIEVIEKKINIETINRI